MALCGFVFFVVLGLVILLNEEIVFRWHLWANKSQSIKEPVKTFAWQRNRMNAGIGLIILGVFFLVLFFLAQTYP
jgi:sterol desaturase/sphingolipid hydroxylase (fatty acid hydroxylase superfamily)